MDLKQLSDDEIIAKIINSGELSYFGELYDRYANKVFRKCYAMVQNEADAEDLTQTILTKTMLNLSKFKGKSSFATWLYRITYNGCLDFLRVKKKKRKVFSDNVDINQTEVEQSDQIEEKKMLEIEIDRVKQIFEHLPSGDRVLILMKYQDGLTVPVIAAQLNATESAIKMRLHRARKRIIEIYRKEFSA